MSDLVETYQDYSGHESGWQGESDWHAVYTIQLGELIEDGIFSWKSDLLDWREVAVSDEQFTRVCRYFIERFRYREISMLPYKEWAQRLYFKIVYELMPKYKYLYERIDAGINPFQNEDEYYKERRIDSAYPETLLSENSDYITDGTDREFEKIVEGDIMEKIYKFSDKYKYCDELLLDGLECMFISMYTANVNA